MKKLRPYQQEVLSKLLIRLKETTHPLLVNASVGSGKSLIIAELLLIMEKANYSSLCLTMNSTLIQQNHDTYKAQHGHPGIYCSGLNAKDTEQCVIFGSPNSVAQAIRNNQQISRKPFKMIIVDEAHNISPHDLNTMYQRIINHYGKMAQEEQYSFRVIGLTGTPYRGKAISIVGPNEFFKEQVCDISTSWLIEQGYLTKPIFNLTHVDSIDTSHLHVENTGKFKHKELEKLVEDNIRLTGEIMHELTAFVENGRVGAFIFASTKKHCLECVKSLPKGQAAIITGDTPHDERKRILEAAHMGHIRYLVNVNCLVTGVDISSFDVCAWLRPTESLTLYVQGIGRVLRLHEGQRYAYVLDYAGNLERHGHIDNPIINEAVKPKQGQEEQFVIPCYQCNTLNKPTARRCIGTVHDKRCEHYFEWKDCSCGAVNDITSRNCHVCDKELIDPNKKLSKIVSKTIMLQVKKAEYWVSVKGHTSNPIINVRYITNHKDVFECYYTNSVKAERVIYAKFIKQHLENSSDYYTKIQNIEWMKKMLTDNIRTPYRLECKVDTYGRYHVLKKFFMPNSDLTMVPIPR